MFQVGRGEGEGGGYSYASPSSPRRTERPSRSKSGASWPKKQSALAAAECPSRESNSSIDCDGRLVAVIREMTDGRRFSLLLDGRGRSDDVLDRFTSWVGHVAFDSS